MQIDGGFSIVGIESPGPAQSRKLATKKGTMFYIGGEYLFDLLRWTDSKINKCKQHSVAVSTIYNNNNDRLTAFDPGQPG